MGPPFARDGTTFWGSAAPGCADAGLAAFPVDGITGGGDTGSSLKNDDHGSVARLCHHCARSHSHARQDFLVTREHAEIDDGRAGGRLGRAYADIFSDSSRPPTRIKPSSGRMVRLRYR